MKSNEVNWILTALLGIFAILSIIFALRAVFLTREFRTLSVQATAANNSLLQVQQLARDVAAYNQKSPNPGLTRLLQSVEAKPAAQ
jgi:hypothetical protein